MRPASEPPAGQRPPLPCTLLTRLRANLPQGGTLPAPLWERRHRAILWLLWLHLPFLLGFALLSHHPLLHVWVELGAIALAALLATFARPHGHQGRRFRATAATFGLVTCSAVLVHMGHGNTELHFHFFVVVSVITLYQEWTPFLLALAYVVLHHGLLGVLDPASVYDHRDAWRQPWLWAAIHGSFVLAASVVGAINWRLNESARLDTGRSEAAEALAQSRARLRSLVQHASDLIVLLDAAGRIRYVSPSVRRVLGYASEALEDADGFAWSDPSDPQLGGAALLASVPQPFQEQRLELELRHADGTRRHFDALVRNLLPDPNVQGVVINARDISERKTYEAQLTHLAFHDALTGLPNRALFLDRLGQALQRAARDQRRVGVLFLDLDNFKLINDSLGHQTGDQLLQQIAARLQDCVRATDTVARFGGDEFTVLLDDLAGEQDGVAVAELLAARLGASLELAGRAMFPSSSIGLVVSAATDTAEGLVRKADLAMYRAKAQGKARHQVYEERMNTAVQERLALESDLRRGLEQGEFCLLYQPILALGTQQLREVEALVRWQHPQRGLMAPVHFIPVAEETGLIVPLGRWVLREACAQAARWQQQAGQTPVMSVNLAARQFQDPALVDDVAAILQETGLPAQRLKLEITESAVMAEVEQAIGTLQALKAMGVHLAIDDFGTGYSSLSYLKRFPVDSLKVDRSFVEGLAQSGNDAAIVRSIVALAQSLGLTVTGEGIETAAQLAQLAALGCEQGQGYLFAKPLPAATVVALLATGRVPAAA
jgi:diguanylate cyclase (GGDEF)-like protein/PAS domain S-box-containing protein